MIKIAFLTLSLAALGMAVSSTAAEPVTATTTGPVTVFTIMIPGVTPTPSHASIIGVGKDAITFGIEVSGCVKDLVGKSCRELKGLSSMTIIQGPKTYSQNLAISEITVDAACSLDGTVLADCTLKINSAKTKASVTTKLTGKDLENAFGPITATAGQEKLQGTPSAGKGPNAGPRATENANWAIGGAAAAVVIAAAL
ncbi:hypothetical protein PABG_11891 [Paracoccidioides brasiliensis Pb03]|uniref:Uncharacterized protein n=2 Tax=Paracoccidioides brasiliensis TaxID=121759 RepID=A0A0A0HRZ2_PARBD|nr:uncharacterized protein PADG_11775 [Paracoccidioides brasiliensis Pb18]KGM91989.1 hypothetical protein PADG_11775 [Paracoccidioides brasiliensis Pb18]KGY15113.1 hypothetical protein PABG_11891 [Paracoccidioides brasiliensis Pb03]ODH30182.1 hypothetical protein ACO22_03632 [Paracoccidioides brasiliensis]ODH50053.1 hypothetical protein GX48_03858 [Paracoccidioides brasiliensis]